MDEATKRHEKALYGNGEKGLIKDVVILKQTVEHMNEHLGSLSKSYAALSKSQIEFDVTEKMKIQSSDKKFKILRTISIVLGISFTLITLINKLL